MAFTEKKMSGIIRADIFHSLWEAEILKQVRIHECYNSFFL